MVVYGKKTINSVTYDHAYSDLGMKIERDGIPYDDALDPEGSGRKYNETDIPIEPVEESEGDA